MNLLAESKLSCHKAKNSQIVRWLVKSKCWLTFIILRIEVKPFSLKNAFWKKLLWRLGCHGNVNFGTPLARTLKRSQLNFGERTELTLVVIALAVLKLSYLQSYATLLDVTCCFRLHTLLHVVGCCCVLLRELLNRSTFSPVKAGETLSKHGL